MNIIQTIIAKAFRIQSEIIELNLQSYRQQNLINQLQHNLNEHRENEKRLYDAMKLQEEEHTAYRLKVIAAQELTNNQLREVEQERLELQKKLDKLAKADALITELKAKIAGLHARIGGLTKAAKKAQQ